VLFVLLKPGREDNLLYGAERSTLDIARALVRLGAHVSVLQWHPSPLPVKSEGIQILRVKGSGVFRLLRLGFSVAGAVKQTKSEAIYAYADYFEDTFVSAYLGSLLARKKLLVAILDDAEREVDGHSLARAFARWHAMGHSYRTSIRIVFFNALRRLSLRTTAVGVVSAESVGLYAKDVLKARRVFLIGRGVDRKWFGRTSDLRKYEAVYVGGLWTYKSVDVLISAWEVVVRRRPGAKLLIVGEGAERPRLETLAAELHLSGAVIFKGNLDDPDEVHKVLSESRMFVFPSINEGRPRVVGEAMATGLPCVLSDIPVFRELYSRTAILVRAGDPGAFAEAILSLLEDSGKRDELSRLGAEASSGLNWDAVAQRVLHVIRRT
jgi:glycosyltransferase involved in cell wall biosynthesis